MMFLVDRELVDEEEELATGGTVALLALKTLRLRPGCEISVSQLSDRSFVLLRSEQKIVRAGLGCGNKINFYRASQLK